VDSELRVNRWARALQVMAIYMVAFMANLTLTVATASWPLWDSYLPLDLACLAAALCLPVAIGILREASKGNRWARGWAWVALFASLPLVAFGLLNALVGPFRT